VFLLGVFAPAFVSIAITWSNGGAPGVRYLVQGIARWQLAGGYYAFAIFLLAAVKLTAALFYFLLTGDWPAFGTTPWPLMLAGILVSTWVQAGEEIGWRAYALPRLAHRLGLAGGSIVLGIIWAFWHLPLFFIPGSGSDGQSFPIYLLYVTALSVAMAWLYWRTGGSLLLTMVMHASMNNTRDIIPSTMGGAANPWSLNASTMSVLTVLLLWLIAVPLLWRMHRVRLATEHHVE